MLFVMLGIWLEDSCSWAEWIAANCRSSQVGVCSNPVSGTDYTAVGHWRWSVSFAYFIARKHAEK